MICIELEVPNLQKIHELPLVQERTKIYQRSVMSCQECFCYSSLNMGNSEIPEKYTLW